MKYENYIFDLYGTLVDIHTDEEKTELWEKLAQFYGYYGAVYTAEELKNAYACLTGQKEDALRQEMGSDAAMKKDDAHEAHPEIEIEEVFLSLFQKKGVQADIDFDDIFLSSSCKVKKPDTRFFHLLLDKHHILPEESIMIGNDAVSDIKGAKEVGLHTFYIHSNISPDTEKKPDADHVLMQMDLAKVRQILISD